MFNVLVNEYNVETELERILSYFIGIYILMQKKFAMY
jgi:hypothetical protein